MLKSADFSAYVLTNYSNGVFSRLGVKSLSGGELKIILKIPVVDNKYNFSPSGFLPVRNNLFIGFCEACEVSLEDETEVAELYDV